MLNTSLQTEKQHYKLLDGLRGLAAIAVVIFHFMEIAVPDYNDSFIAHAYLAVDFFFCLSGFVIAYAYDQRLEEMGVWNFFKIRLVRLQPLVIVGSVIGLAAFIFDPFSDLYEKYADRLIQIFLSSCLMVPYPVVPERYFNLFHLNPPTWSLFWEYIANIGYALILIKISKKWLIGLTIIAAGLLIYEAQRSGFLAVGFGGDNVAGGGIRVMFSFLAGILLYRTGSVIKSKITFPAMCILLMLVFLVPFSEKLNPIADPLIVVVYLPLLVAIGAGGRLSKAFEGICKFSGDISYPLYMIHYPFIWIFMSYVEKYHPGMPEMTAIMVIGTLLLVGLAYVVLRCIDLPLRKVLKKRLTSR